MIGAVGSAVSELRHSATAAWTAIVAQLRSATLLDAVRGYGDTLIARAGDEPIAVDDAAVLAAYGLIGRAAQATVTFWRTGDESAAAAALAACDQARRILLDACVVDTWMLVDSLRLVLEDVFASATWRQLRRAPNWNNLWDRHLRLLASDPSPVVQVWPSQRQALDGGLLDPARQTLAVTMPTSSGKTRMAEFAILSALADRHGAGLAVYIVPTRALAAEVERDLNRTLGRVGLRVSGFFGGRERNPSTPSQRPAVLRDLQRRTDVMSRFAVRRVPALPVLTVGR